MPVYKCPKCGRTVEMPHGIYYCKVCGPSAILRSVPRVAPEDVLYYERLPSVETVRKFLVTTDWGDIWDFVKREGIFQFWNREYIECLAGEIKRRVGFGLVLEVCAGDGMLSYWLRTYDVNAKATDSGAWYNLVKRRVDVEIIDAVPAIRKYKPDMVIASWIPYGENIDIEIFDECSRLRIPYIILIGETDGACGTPKFWEQKYWEKVGYKATYLDKCDRYNFCRTDSAFDKRIIQHSSTILYTLTEGRE